MSLINLDERRWTEMLQVRDVRMFITGSSRIVAFLGQIAKYILAECQAHVNKPWA